MAQYDASSAEVFIFTFKEGVLAAMAHDLQLRASRFTITETDTGIRADVDAASLKVMHPMLNGQPNPSLLGAVTYGEIEKNITRAVLDLKKAASVVFESTERGADFLAGDLSINGVHKPVRWAVVERASRRVATLTIDQRDFRIVPYSAMLGALKVQPQVRLEVHLPLKR